MRDCGINASNKLTNGLLNERALRITGTEESEVDGQQNPATLREGDGGHNETKQKGDFKVSNDLHATVVVSLDESTDVLDNRVLRRLGAGGAWGRSSRLWVHSRDYVGASVGRNVEDRVNAEGEQSQDKLARVEPNEGHCYKREEKKKHQLCGLNALSRAP